LGKPFFESILVVVHLNTCKWYLTLVC